MKVRELMTPNPICAEPDTTVEELASMMKEANVGCIPVIDEDGQVAGVVTDRDIVLRCIAEGKDASECRADDVISPQTVTIDPNADSSKAARLMAEHQVRRLPVVERNTIVGMLSLGDVAVKQHDDRLSGDVLEEVSEGVKTASDANRMSAHQGGSRSGVRRDAAVDELSEDARPTAPFDSGRTSVTDIGQEAASRHEKVIPFREERDNRVRSEAQNRAQNRKKVG